MISELTESNNMKKAKLFQIISYLSMHCLLGQLADMSALLLWAWADRSGPYSSTVYNNHGELGYFICISTAYVMMSNGELGLHTFTKRDDGNRFNALVEDATVKGNEIGIKLRPDCPSTGNCLPRHVFLLCQNSRL